MTIFTLMGEILLKDNGTKDKLNEINAAGEKASGGLTGAFGKIGSAALKVGGIIAAGLGFHAMLAGAENSQKALAQMDSVLKSTGDASGMTKSQLLALADSQGKLTEFSKGTNIESENLLLTFTNIGKDVFPDALKSVNDMSQALGQDTKSSCIQLGKALNDPIKGVTALSRVGVTFTEGQKKQIAAMVESGNVAGAQKIILQELQREFGGSAEAAGKTFGGQLTILKNRLAGLGITIMSGVMPYLTSFVTSINSNMPKIQQTVTSIVASIGPILTGIAKDIGQIIVNIAGLGGSTQSTGNIILSVVKGGFTALKDVFDWIAQHGELTRAAIIGIGSAFAALKIINTATTAIRNFSNGMNLVEGATGIVSRFGTAFAELRTAPTILTGIKGAFTAIFGVNPMILLVVAAVTLLAAGAYELVTHWTQVKGFFTGLWTAVKQKFTEFWNWLKPFMAQWGPVILTVIAPFIGVPLLIVQHWTQIKATLTGVWNSIKTTATSVFNGIASFFTSIWAAISNTFKTVITAIVNFVTTNFSGVISGIQTIFSGIKDYFTGIWEAIKAIFMGAVLLLVDLVTGNFTKLSSDAQLIWNDLKTAFSTIWSGIKEVFSGALQAIESYYTTIFNTMIDTGKNLWNGLKDFLSSLWEGIKSTASSAWNSLKDAVISIITSVVDTAKNIWNGLLSWFESLPSRLYNAGSNMFNSLKSGISSVLSTITSVVQNGFNGAINFIKSLPAKALQWGKDFIDGLINGIKGSIGKVGDAVSSVGDKIRSILHFSVPDEGPLTDYENWMPDFMAGLANGIDSNKFKVADSIKSLAGDMKLNVNANGLQNGINNTADAKNNGGTVINQYNTINSPKSLSPSETARQNKRMLQQIGLQLS